MNTVKRSREPMTQHGPEVPLFPFYGYADFDKKRKPGTKLEMARALWRQHAREYGHRLYGRPDPSLCLCSPADAEVLGKMWDGIEVRGRPFISAGTFYLGDREAHEGGRVW